MFVARYRGGLGMALAVGTLASCVLFQARPYQPLPPTEAQRAAFGSIAVVAHATPPVLALQPPTAGWLRGLGIGTARGGAVLILAPLYGTFAGLSGGPFGAALGAALGATAGALYLPSSMIAGAITAPSSSDVTRATAVLEGALARAASPALLARRFRALVATNAQRDGADGGLVTVDGDGRSHIEPHALVADTVIELRLDKVGNGRTTDLWTLDRACELQVEASLRIVRTADRKLLYTTSVVYQDELRRRTYTAWAASGEAGLQLELDRALTEACEVLVDELFLISLDQLRQAHGLSFDYAWRPTAPTGEVNW